MSTLGLLSLSQDTVPLALWGVRHQTALRAAADPER
jgi:hypothetical protein